MLYSLLLVKGLFDSLVIDFDGMIDQAFSLINSLWPVFVVPIAFALAFGLIAMIIKNVKDSLTGH
jgi:hypothetical protein